MNNLAGHAGGVHENSTQWGGSHHLEPPPTFCFLSPGWLQPSLTSPRSLLNVPVSVHHDPFRKASMIIPAILTSPAQTPEFTVWFPHLAPVICTRLGTRPLQMRLRLSSPPQTRAQEGRHQDCCALAAQHPGPGLPVLPLLRGGDLCWSLLLQDDSIPAGDSGFSSHQGHQLLGVGLHG